MSEGPAPRELVPTRNALVQSGELDIISQHYFGGQQKKPVAMRMPNLRLFSKSEIQIVDEVIEEFWTLNGKQVSDRSHTEYGWLLTEPGETIPYSAAFFSTAPLTQEQVEKGQEIASRHELTS